MQREDQQKNNKEATEMMFKIRHGLLEVTNYPTNKKSAIIFNDDFIITTAFLLYPHFRKYDHISNKSQRDAIINKLNKHEIVDSENEFLQTFRFEITFDQTKMGAKSKTLLKCRAEILHIFNCPDICSSTGNIMGALYDPSENDELHSYNRNLHKIAISSFIILRLIYPDGRPKSMKSFTGQMKNYIKFIDVVNKLDDVLTISTPFGMESFYKTINIGKVSNVFGTDSCLFTISNNLVNGCEGAAVINSRLRLIGIVICTTFRCNNENANLTLSASFRYVLKQFLRQTGETYSNGFISRKLISPAWEKSIVLLRNDGSCGTGTLLKINNTKFILTCSHVIKNPKEKISCHYVDGIFETKLLWKNPLYNQPYDIAMLDVPSHLPDDYYLQISTDMPHLGQAVVSAGFPLNSQIGKEVHKPSLLEGRIIKFLPGMIISDASVQAGQSGGPLLDSNGKLLGVCVSNSKDEETQMIYPNINMAVPLWNIRTILRDFAKTRDVEILNSMIASNDIKEVWSLKGPLVESKL